MAVTIQQYRAAVDRYGAGEGKSLVIQVENLAFVALPSGQQGAD
jgi:hypothetical protein